MSANNVNDDPSPAVPTTAELATLNSRPVALLDELKSPVENACILADARTASVPVPSSGA